jgi:ferredoxin--NADP+ reductase
VIPNDRGRVVGAERTYCAGWIKRGPSGVIGTNKKDATETVELVLEDAVAGKLVAPNRGDLAALLEERDSAFIEYDGWQAIDAVERATGEPLGRPRVKVTGWSDLLETGRSVQSSS